MTKTDKQEFKVLIKESTIEALKSSEGQDAIAEALTTPKSQNAIIGALRSQGGQGAIVDAMNSTDGQQAIKRGSLAALKSEEGQSILVDNFVETFHEAIVPSLVARIKESAVKREELTEIIKRKMKGLSV